MKRDTAPLLPLVPLISDSVTGGELSLLTRRGGGNFISICGGAVGTFSKKRCRLRFEISHDFFPSPPLKYFPMPFLWGEGCAGEWRESPLFI